MCFDNTLGWRGVKSPLFAKLRTKFSVKQSPKKYNDKNQGEQPRQEELSLAERGNYAQK